VAAELRAHGIYPKDATRYRYEGQLFMESLPPVARMAFAKGEFKPELAFVPPKVKKNYAFDAWREFGKRVNARARRSEREKAR
jgi:hypothetical protein